MKTQIIPRIIFVAFALIFSINNNNGSFRQPAFASNHKANNYLAAAHQENQTEAHHNETSVPYLPQSDGHHDFDCFDFKHHEKRILWKCIANKIFASIYHIIILMPVILETLKEFFL